MRRGGRWLIGFVALGVLGIVAILGALIVAPRLLPAQDSRAAEIQRREDEQAAINQQSAAERAALRRQLDEAEQRWNRQGITSYRIVVRDVQSTWHLQWNTVVVRNGQVTGRTGRCIRAPAEVGECEVRPFDPGKYTVPGLFATAHRLLDNAGPGDVIKITYDDVYGYPRTMLNDHPPIVHADGFAEVESLTPL
jgi:type II secretory pathway pseudopilin PulG